MSNILSPLPQCLWPPNLALWWYTMRSCKVTWCYNSCEVTQQIKCVISPFPPYMERWWITMGLPSIKPRNSLNFGYKRLHGKLTLNSTVTMPMVTKLVSMVTYLEEFPSINLDDLLVMWSCKVMRHIKNISAYRRPMGTKIVNASTHNVAWPFDQVTNLRPCNKLKKKLYRSFTSFMTTKLGQVLTWEKKFRMQAFKSSPISC